METSISTCSSEAVPVKSKPGRPRKNDAAIAVTQPKVKRGKRAPKPIVTEEFYARMLVAANDINQYADRLWADQAGQSFPLYTKFRNKTCLMRELTNLTPQSKFPVLAPAEMKEGKILDAESGTPLEFNFTPETWAVLRECVNQIGFHDITNKFDINKIMRYHRSGKFKKEAMEKMSLATV
jgi:hypothetical protein